MFCLATDLDDLKERAGPHRRAPTPTTASPSPPGMIGAAGAMTALLKDALKPNLVQTLEHTPAIIHGGPFANIAHGCNSVIATKLSLKLADYVVTEAGFGADLGAEKFLDIKCRMAGLHPAAVVLVATVRALKYHGGVAKADLSKPNAEAVKAGAVQPGTPHREHAGASACRSAWPSTPSPPTPRRRWPSSTTSAPRPVCPAR